MIPEDPLAQTRLHLPPVFIRRRWYQRIPLGSGMLAGLIAGDEHKLLGLLAGLPRVRCRPMIAVVDEAPTAVIPAVHDGGPSDYTGRVTTKESES